jgi:hypothetical protein
MVQASGRAADEDTSGGLPTATGTGVHGNELARRWVPEGRDPREVRADRVKGGA